MNITVNNGVGKKKKEFGKSCIYKMPVFCYW